RRAARDDYRRRSARSLAGTDRRERPGNADHSGRQRHHSESRPRADLQSVRRAVIATGQWPLASGYWMLTFSNVQAAAAALVWLVTASPMRTEGPIGIVSVPTTVQFTPSADS